MLIGGRRRRAARVVVFDDAGRVLLISAHDPARRNRGRWWEIPGGGIDPGEDTHEAVRRELWEEAGIDDAEIGPVVFTQSVEFTFGGFTFDQDEWIHVARCSGRTDGPKGLEALEAMAFGEQRWWEVEDFLATPRRTIPYRLGEHLIALRNWELPEDPIDITPDQDQVRQWQEAGTEAGGH
jgi:8-oxo-dGTP pyrophosphatase MutT (NUDIX family)